MHIMHFLSTFDKEYASDFLSHLQGLTSVWFGISVPNPFYCGILQEV